MQNAPEMTPIDDLSRTKIIIHAHRVCGRCESYCFVKLGSECFINGPVNVRGLSERERLGGPLKRQS
ncbi:MAG: hypothetical protein ACKER6_00385 [Candidatus Hodgkinia cicadicola]